MISKRGLILICLVICLISVSSVAASDINETITSNENLQNELINVKNNEIDDVLEMTEENDEKIAFQEDDVLNDYPRYNDYSVSVSDVSYTYGSTATIKMTISPADGFDQKYFFYMYVVDSDNYIKIKKSFANTKYKTSESYSIGSNELEPGIYSIKILNFYDRKVMDSSQLTVKSIPYNKYSVSVSDVSVNYWSSASIKMTISPFTSSTYTYRYDYYFKIYDSENVEKISKRYYGTTSSKSQTYSLPAKNLTAGTYTIKIVNAYDKMVMDTANLIITSVPYDVYSASVSDVTINYGSSGSIKMTVTPSTSTNYDYKYDFYMKVYDSDNVEKISQRYYSTKSTKSLTYTIESEKLDIGEYTIKLLNNGDNHVMSTAKLYVKSLPYSVYSANVEDTVVNYGSSGSIKISISPSRSTAYKYKYDFYLKIYDSYNVLKVNNRYYSTANDYSQTYTFQSNKFDPGVYTISIVNNRDSYQIDSAKLTISKITLETQDIVADCDNVLQYKIRASENGEYKSGITGVISCNGKDYPFSTDINGYATVNIPLKAGTYEVTVKSGGAVNRNTIKINSVYIADRYKNVRIIPQNALYKQNKLITYSFEGNLNGVFKIYKGNSLKYSQSFNTNGVINEAFTYKKHSFNYPIKNLKETGTYTAKIVNAQGKVLASSSFKITKAPSRAYTYSFTTLGGFKETVEAYALDEKGNINDMGGTAKFKIKGKTYKAKVKNGYAKVKVKFSKKKKAYKCSVKFSGDKNHKSSNTKFKIKVTTLKNPIKVGKYKIKLTGKQYNAVSKSIKKCNSKTFNIKTKYNHAFKKPYYKQVKKYRTTTSVKTLYAGSYLPTMNKMWDNGWSKVSEYTYVKKNQHPGIGLSAYTIAVTKWVKVSYKKAYTTKYYPVKAKIKTGYNWMEKPSIKLYANGKTLKNGKLSFR